MARTSASKLVRVAYRGLQTTCAARNALPTIAAVSVLSHPAPRVPARRLISSSASLQGITPDNKGAKDVETPSITKTPTSMTDSEYHAVADDYLETLLTRLEEMQDAREDVDVEFSAGVLTLSLGPHIGTYVINKQPPNKQIWLSSPKTGPKRYDYVTLGEGQHEKQDTATGDWVYLRDGSTLNDLLVEEIGIDITTSNPEIRS
ncbi:hypothetical protein N0V88_000644 [Collariella sp. IMI 366227]|nr:hypothetical protein N0V88_000644 [Collariella sp. IMI 366227]